MSGFWSLWNDISAADVVAEVGHDVFWGAPHATSVPHQVPPISSSVPPRASEECKYGCLSCGAR